ncbi:AAA family ATPase [Paraburkholderia sp. RL17-337-BIB-A]|uniref:AAA family ATPase n=1 Tax=Paraburkholderia sp. RL17-337-BIB-A TaxID=3031636 RepID=UPI0038B98C5D
MNALPCCVDSRTKASAIDESKSVPVLCCVFASGAEARIHIIQQKQGPAMRLNAVHVTNFRSVEDSGKFNVGNMTCLVGKNEAGKTALLSALYGLNAYGTLIYDKTRDYPRRFVSDFDERHPEGRSIVVNTSWVLDHIDVAAVAAVLGDKALIKPEIGLTRGIGYEKKEWDVPVDDASGASVLDEQARARRGGARGAERRGRREGRRCSDRRTTPTIAASASVAGRPHGVP